MQFRQLGHSGLKLSCLSLGSWITFNNQLQLAGVKELISCAYDAGVNFFDNAESYAHGASELLMGQALAELNYPRDAWCVSSKVFFGSAKTPRPTQQGLSRKHVRDACDAALRRLRVEYLDLYFCHRPDPATPIAEVVCTMNQLISAGKVLYWGTSEWSAKDIQSAHDFALRNNLLGPSMEQPQYNLLHRHRVESEYQPLYQGIGLGTTVWSPLASGLLSGKYQNAKSAELNQRFGLPGLEWVRDLVLGSDAEQKFAQVARLSQIADSIGTTLPRLAIAWCLRNPNVSTVILGASSRAQLEHNLGAIAVLDQLEDKFLRELESALLGL